MVMISIPRVTLTPLSDGKDTLEKCYSTLRQVDMHGSLCIANLFTQNIPTVPGLLWFWIPPMSTYIRVLCYLLNYHAKHPQDALCSSTGRAEHNYPDIGATLSVQATSCQMEHSLFYSPEYSQVIALYDYTAGRCCLYRAMGRDDLPIC